MQQPVTSDLLRRFHRTLVEEIRRTRPEYLSSPFTVAEIYQNLVPYRTHRDQIGVEMNGDYEDALLRLLAGEGDYLVLESDHARRRLGEELESPNPNTGLFREYAAVDVRLNPDRVPAGEAKRSEAMEPAGERTPGDLWSAGFSPADEAPSRDAADDEDETVSVESLAPAATAVGTEGSGGDTVQCRWCSEALPRRDVLNYCPHCGANLHLVPCPNCGEELEPSWRFCVACGTET